MYVNIYVIIIMGTSGWCIILNRFVDGIILELGSGLGLTGIVTSNWSHHTFCTGMLYIYIYIYIYVFMQL